MKRVSVYIYGNGHEATKTLNRLSELDSRIDLRGIIVSDKFEQIERKESLYELDEIGTFDFIIIAVYNWREIYEILHNYGVPNSKIILSAEFYNTQLQLDTVINRNREEIIEPDYYKYYKKFDEGYMKDTILSYPPRHITIAVTSACKNTCIFCAYHGEEYRSFSKVYGLPFSLKLDHFKKIVDMAYNAGVPHVHICATGEPFANPEIMEMLDYVIFRYGTVSVQTEFWPDVFKKNNYLYELCRREKSIEYITTDIFSADDEIHNNIKKGTKLKEILCALRYISKNSSIKLRINIILTKRNYKGLYKIIERLCEEQIINYEIIVINLYTYKGSDFTSRENQYISSDNDVREELSLLQEYASKYGINCVLPEPVDIGNDICDHFWTKFQTWPVKGCDKEKWAENMVPMACAAVVNGNLNSLGYLCDYDNLMDAWNNEKLIKIRKDLLEGKFPSEECANCHLCKSKN